MVAKINIGFLGNQIASGGGSSSLLLMIKSLDKSKYNIFVLTSDCASEKKRQEFEKYANVVIVNKEIKQFVSCAGHKASYFEWLKAITTSNKQSKIVNDFIVKYDIKILHINNAVFSHLYEKIKRRTGVFIVSHIREQVDLYKKTFLEQLIIANISKYSDKIITISDNEAKPFFREKCQIIPNPFDFSDLNNLQQFDMNRKYQIENDTILIAMLGRFSKDKGHLLFLNTANCLIKEDKKIKFILIGVNPQKPKWKLFIKKILLFKDFRKEVEKYISSNNLNNHVILIPHTPDILPLIKAIDIIVRPSLTGDPWGRDIIEAMSLSKPVVATGASQFFIKNGETGYLVAPHNPQMLAEKIKLLMNGVRRKEFGDEGYRVIRQLCDIDQFGQKIQNLYSELI